jgi:hypothetical protein
MANPSAGSRDTGIGRDIDGEPDRIVPVITRPAQTGTGRIATGDTGPTPTVS